MLGRGMVWPGRIRCPHCLTAIRTQMMGWLWIALLLLIALPFAGARWGLISQPVLIATVLAVYLGSHRLITAIVIGRARFRPQGQGRKPPEALLPGDVIVTPARYEGRFRRMALIYMLYDDRVEQTLPNGSMTWPLIRMKPEPIFHREWPKPFVAGCVMVSGGILTLGVLICKEGIRGLPDPMGWLWLGAIAVGAALVGFYHRRIVWARFLQEGVDGPAGWLDIPRLDDRPAEFEPFVERVIRAALKTRTGSHGDDR